MLTALKRLARSNGNVLLRDYTRLVADLLALYSLNTTASARQGFYIEGSIRVKRCFKSEKVKR